MRFNVSFFAMVTLFPRIAVFEDNGLIAIRHLHGRQEPRLLEEAAQQAACKTCQEEIEWILDKFDAQWAKNCLNKGKKWDSNWDVYENQTALKICEKMRPFRSPREACHDGGYCPPLVWQWVQIGNDIGGEGNGDGSGHSVSLSSDGKRVAIGACENDGNGSNSGHTRVYEFDENHSSWVQLGDDITGKTFSEYSGYSVLLSANGTRLAIGSLGNNGMDGLGGPSTTGLVRVYEYENGTSSWKQLGANIEGEAAGDSSAQVWLSGDGTRVAIGAPDHDRDGISSGRVRVYGYDSNYGWQQLGEDIEGANAFDLFGWSVSLSYDGSRVAIGAPGYDNATGHVWVYQYNGSSWANIGDVEGEAAFDLFGISVSLSSDGSRVAIGATYSDGNGEESGHAGVYEYKGGQSWEQVGENIVGESKGDWLGDAVSLSLDGSNVAVGGSRNDGNGVDSGHTRVYKYESNDGCAGAWKQVGLEIQGEAAGDGSGSSVSLSSDGTRVAIGAPSSDENGMVYSGHVRVFELVAT